MRLRYFAAAAVLSAFLAACTASATGTVTPNPTGSTAATASSGPAAMTAAVTIQGFAFNPATVTIAKGGTVTWTNQDSAPHTATPDSAGFTDTGTLAQGKAGSATFATAGTYTYHCTFHANMKATVIVQ